MPHNKDLKRLVRARMAQTGERYTEALAAILAQAKLDPVPAPWFMAGSHPTEYEVGLLSPDITEDGGRVVQLRLKSGIAVPGGFGTLMQSFAATRYVTSRVRFSAMVRAVEVTDWAGLWMRVDGPEGSIEFDNMQDRPLRETTGWARPAVVLDVPEEAKSIHFGVLLSGGGAVEFSQARFEEVDTSVPVTSMRSSHGPLPDEPQALDFGAA